MAALLESKRVSPNPSGLSAELHLVRLVPFGIAPLPVVATVEALRSLLDGEGGDKR